MHARLVYIFILINILNALAVPYWSNILSKRRKYCGSDVTSALRIICEGNHYGTTMKRSDLLAFYNRLKNHLDSEELQFLPSSEDLAESLVPAKSREGITEECCTKSCSINELRAYCAA
ncbi:insulin [Leptinotarsa decemlineata]|uniref:Insulin-like peptide-1c n=1 Tax=Leptinotarsa decemlineata TaxID=7539 RepID=A0A0K0PQM1_LEPDE|nr:LIRP-like [Leptinotarsa decemlineata]AKQ48975.1 insulin-like peptide-1c [Leptinotarsa decemlineata]